LLCCPERASALARPGCSPLCGHSSRNVFALRRGLRALPVVIIGLLSHRSSSLAGQPGLSAFSRCPCLTLTPPSGPPSTHDPRAFGRAPTVSGSSIAHDTCALVCVRHGFSQRWCLWSAPGSRCARRQDELLMGCPCWCWRAPTGRARWLLESADASITGATPRWSASPVHLPLLPPLHRMTALQLAPRPGLGAGVPPTRLAFHRYFATPPHAPPILWHKSNNHLSRKRMQGMRVRSLWRRSRSRIPGLAIALWGSWVGRQACARESSALRVEAGQHVGRNTRILFSPAPISCYEIIERRPTPAHAGGALRHTFTGHAGPGFQRLATSAG